MIRRAPKLRKLVLKAAPRMLTERPNIKLVNELVETISDAIYEGTALIPDRETDAAIRSAVLAAAWSAQRGDPLTSKRTKR
jgi:hypothetical protein